MPHTVTTVIVVRNTAATIQRAVIDAESSGKDDLCRRVASPAHQIVDGLGRLPGH